MDSKAAFESLVNSGSDMPFEDMQGMLISLLEYISTIDYQRIYQKPEIHRLLSSELMRDAVVATEEDRLLFLYDTMYNSVKVAKSEELGYFLSAVLIYGLPILLLIAVLGILVYMVFSSYNKRISAAATKKMLKAQKRERRDKNA